MEGISRYDAGGRTVRMAAVACDMGCDWHGPRGGQRGRGGRGGLGNMRCAPYKGQRCSDGSPGHGRADMGMAGMG